MGGWEENYRREEDKTIIAESQPGLSKKKVFPIPKGDYGPRTWPSVWSNTDKQPAVQTHHLASSI